MQLLKDIARSAVVLHMLTAIHVWIASSAPDCSSAALTADPISACIDRWYDASVMNFVVAYSLTWLLCAFGPGLAHSPNCRLVTTTAVGVTLGGAPIFDLSAFVPAMMIVRLCPESFLLLGKRAVSTSAAIDKGDKCTKCVRQYVKIDFSNSVEAVLAAWRQEGTCIGSLAVQYECNILSCEPCSCEPCPGRHRTLNVAARVWVQDSKPEEGMLKVRSDHLKQRGLPYPRDLYYKLLCRTTAERQGSEIGMKITFKGIAYNGNGERKWQDAKATFQLDDVFIDDDFTCPCTVSLRVDNVLRGDRIVADPVKLFKPRGVYFADAFFEGLGPERTDALSEYMDAKCEEERELAREAAIEEERRMCGVVSACVPYYKRLYCLICHFSPDCFENATVLQKIINKPPTAQVLISGQATYREALGYEIKQEFSGYGARGWDVAADRTLLTLLCTARTGSAGERCEAAENLEIIRRYSDIQPSDIDDHLYPGYFFWNFAPILRGGRNLKGSSVLDMLDRNSRWYKPEWEAALKMEYGDAASRNAHGKWCPAAVTRFAYPFAFVTQAVPTPTSRVELEAVYKAIVKLADAHVRFQGKATWLELCAGERPEAAEAYMKLRHLKLLAETPAIKQEAMRMQAICHVAPETCGIPAQASSSWECEMDTDDGSDQSDSDSDFNDQEPEEPKTSRGHARILLQDMPISFKKARIGALRKIKQAALEKNIDDVLKLLPSGFRVEVPWHLGWRGELLFCNKIWGLCFRMLAFHGLRRRLGGKRQPTGSCNKTPVKGSASTTEWARNARSLLGSSAEICEETPGDGTAVNTEEVDNSDIGLLEHSVGLHIEC